MTKIIKLKINLFKSGVNAPSRAQRSQTPGVIVGTCAGYYSSTNRLDDGGGYTVKTVSNVRLTLPRRLMVDKEVFERSADAALDVIRLGVCNNEVSDTNEFCCANDFLQVAEQIKEMAIKGTVFTGQCLGSVHPVALKGTIVMTGQTVQVIKSAEPLLGDYYLYAYQVGAATQAAHFQLQPLPGIDSQSDCLAFIRVMAKRSLIAVPV